jgi:hypothetical protein
MEPWNINIRHSKTGDLWYVDCPETGDSTSTGSFTDAVMWAAAGLTSEQSITLHLL